MTDPLLKMCQLMSAVKECGIKLSIEWRARGVEVWVNGGQEPSGYPDATFDSMDAFCEWMRDMVVGHRQALIQSAERSAAEARRLAEKLKSF